MHSAVSQKGRFRELSHQLGAEFIDIGNRIHCDHAKKAASCRSLCRACEKLNPERQQETDMADDDDLFFPETSLPPRRDRTV